MNWELIPVEVLTPYCCDILSDYSGCGYLEAPILSNTLHFPLEGDTTKVLIQINGQPTRSPANARY
tara:strand:- start:220 stop:417 length:198 start_codon:yes stop_codon:yes gene_type:complete